MYPDGPCIPCIPVFIVDTTGFDLVPTLTTRFGGVIGFVAMNYLETEGVTSAIPSTILCFVLSDVLINSASYTYLPGDIFAVVAASNDNEILPVLASIAAENVAVALAE
jgi:hypothetical protein